MKKIAVQLCGHLRSYKDTYTSFRDKLLLPLKKNGYDVDVFLHSWTQTDTSEKSWHNIEGDARGKEITEDDVKRITQAYHPQKLLVENQLLVNNFELREKFMNLPRQYSAIINSAYTKYRVNELRLHHEREHHIQYDYVIQTRPDIMFNNEFSIDNFLNTYGMYDLEPPQNAIFTACVPFRRGLLEDDIFLCSIDLIFFSIPEVMNKVSNLYNAIKSGELSTSWINDNLYSLEILWLMYVKSLKIKLVRLKYFQFDDYDIVRNTNEYSKMSQYKDASILKQEHNNKLTLKILQKRLLKLMPYFMVENRIEKLNNDIYKKF